MADAKYYDWNSTISYDADITIVISARGYGKTYGLRKQFLSDYKKHGWRFVEITRTKEELTQLIPSYFDRVGNEWPDRVFKVEKNVAYCALKPEEGEKVPSGAWECLGYFVALTELQTVKKRTFNRVKRLVFDEAIIEKIDRYHGYLPYEWDAIASIIDSCTRERADDDERIKPKLYLLGNACDLINPYFRMLGIKRAPEYGKQWYVGKTCLLDYVAPGEYAARKARETLSGRMLSMSGGGASSLRNEFSDGKRDANIAVKPARAKFVYGFVYDNDSFGVWEDKKEGYIYLTGKIPKNHPHVYALTVKNGDANMLVAKRAEPSFKWLVNLCYAGLVKYESPYVRAKALDVLGLFGVR